MNSKKPKAPYKHSLLYIPLIWLLTSFTFALPTFANSVSIVLPDTIQPVKLDGRVDDNEWSDASNISFKAVSNETAHAYLKYDPQVKLLYGAFTIPDETPSDNDQIWFVFDPNHSGGTVGDKRQGDFVLELWRGFFTYSYTPDESNYAFVNYAITDWSESFIIDPSKPFTSLNYNFTESKSNWQGEFKASIADLQTAKIGFLIDQFDAPEDGAEPKETFFPASYVFGSGASNYSDLIFPEGAVTPNVSSMFDQGSNNESIIITLVVVALATVLTIFVVLRLKIRMHRLKDQTV